MLRAMFFRKKRARRAPPATVGEALLALVREHMPDAEEAEVRIVAAVAGLLASVAYADGEYSRDEAREVERLLGRIHGLPPRAVEAVAALLGDRVAELARGDVHEHTRAIKEGTEREARIEVLDVLMELAAADGSISVAETELLRRVAKLLGLSGPEYTAVQARHRDKLSVIG